MAFNKHTDETKKLEYEVIADQESMSERGLGSQVKSLNAYAKC